jgi:hypothetical protein
MIVANLTLVEDTPAAFVRKHLGAVETSFSGTFFDFSLTMQCPAKFSLPLWKLGKSTR